MALARTVALAVVAAALAVLVALVTGSFPEAGGVSASGRPGAVPRPDASASAHSVAGSSSRSARTVPSPAPSSERPSVATTALPADSGTGRRVVYSVSRQRVWTVGDDGQVSRTYPVSGQSWQPDPGSFRVYSRSRTAASAVSDETMEYMIRFTHGKNTGAAIGFHTIPVDHTGRPVQRVDELGEPLSSGCIRQDRPDAVHLWQFAPVGTSVVVLA